VLQRPWRSANVIAYTKSFREEIRSQPATSGYSAVALGVAGLCRAKVGRTRAATALAKRQCHRPKETAPETGAVAFEFGLTRVLEIRVYP